MNSFPVSHAGTVCPSAAAAEIGSDFDMVDDRFIRPSPETLPWGSGERTTYLESGRQALFIAEQQLRAAGHKTIHVPSYLCDSMIEPFADKGWRLIPLPVDHNLAVNAYVVAGLTNTVLLHAKYFGAVEHNLELAALRNAQAAGTVILSDETHRVLSVESPVADIRIASLRKVLPVYDGAYIVSPQRQHAADAWDDVAPTHLRRLAMASKTRALSANSSNTSHLKMFRAAEDIVEGRREPRTISQESFALLQHLDLSLLREQRARNASFLASLLKSDLAHYRIVNPPTEHLLPSHLVLETSAAQELRTYLAKQKVYCAIHWPESRLLRLRDAWPSRYISLPVDHRYGNAEMMRLHALITCFFRNEQSDGAPLCLED